MFIKLLQESHFLCQKMFFSLEYYCEIGSFFSTALHLKCLKTTDLRERRSDGQKEVMDETTNKVTSNIFLFRSLEPMDFLRF